MVFVMLRDYQKQASDAAVHFFGHETKKGGLIIMPTGCHAKGTQVLMYDGSLKKVEDVRVGDTLLGVDSTPRTVLQLHNGQDDMYMITPKKGNPFVVNAGHILSLYKTNEGGKSPRKRPRIDNISVKDYIETSKNYKHLHKLYRIGMVEFGNPHVVCAPYLLGLYLGDGSTAGGCCFNITTQREEVANYLKTFAENNGFGLRIILKKDCSNKAKTYSFSDMGSGKPNVIHEWLRLIGLYKLTSGDKYIPDVYKTASIHDRLLLLAGLLDTDAFYDLHKNTYEYCTKSWKLANDIVYLCRSLGFMCNIGTPKVVNDTRYYRMSISGDLENIPVKVSIRKGKNRKQKKSILVTGFSVQHVGMGEYYGFTLDGDNLYMDEQFFVHHNCGKSHVVADIARRLGRPVLIFCPSKEILQQNYEKLEKVQKGISSMYSASVRKKDISMVTFATIGSVMRHIEDFDLFKYIIIDECHLCNAEGGMYETFIHRCDRKVVGLTATPYRLTQAYEGGSILKFLTRTRPRLFDSVIYYCQISDILSKGYLADISYYDVSDKVSFDLSRVLTNSTGLDFDEKSLKDEMERSNFSQDLFLWTLRVLNPKDGSARQGILVFTRYVKESEELAARLAKTGISAAIVTGKTPRRERERIITLFRKGDIKVVANAGCLSIGFDYPELDTIILARPTKSLALYYQQVGRCIRPYAHKNAWVIDLTSNLKRFGKVSDLKIGLEKEGTQRWAIFSRGRQLTNVPFF